MTISVPTIEKRLEHLLAQIGERNYCQGCAMPIYWVTHRNGKKTPYTAEGENFGVNHFIDCPKRANFKR